MNQSIQTAAVSDFKCSVSAEEFDPRFCSCGLQSLKIYFSGKKKAQLPFIALTWCSFFASISSRTEKNC